MALANYNGFPGKMRDKSTKAQEQFWSDHAESDEFHRPEHYGCMACLQRTGLIQGHLEDYSQVEVYMPLCVTCHLLLHMRWQPSSIWEDYKKAVRYGFQGPARMSLSGIFPFLSGKYPELLYEDGFYVNEFRPATCLDFLSPIKFTHPNAPDAP